jgi:hypothetical protein
MQAPPGAARSSCRWVPVRTIEVPSDANFIDYAAMAYSYKLGKLAILSQENAAVWVRLLWCGCCCRHLGVPPASLSHHPGPLSLSSSFLIFFLHSGSPPQRETVSLASSVKLVHSRFQPWPHSTSAGGRL